MSGKFYKIFFFWKKNFGRKKFSEKNIFQKKKIEKKKKVLITWGLANFLNRIKIPRGKTSFGGPFLLRKSRKIHVPSLLCYAKNRVPSNFFPLFFCLQKLLQKSREDKPPSCFAKCECNLDNPLRYFAVRCVVVCPSKRLTPKRSAPKRLAPKRLTTKH